MLEKLRGKVDKSNLLDASLIQGMKKCISYQKRIEELQEASPSGTKRKVDALAKDVQKEIASLKPGEKLYIPGGAVGALEQMGMIHMLYEVTRNSADPTKLDFRVLNQSHFYDPAVMRLIINPDTPLKKGSINPAQLGQLVSSFLRKNPVTDQTIPENIFCNYLKDLIDVQVVSNRKLETMGVFAYLKLTKDIGVNAFQRMRQPPAPTPKQAAAPAVAQNIKDPAAIEAHAKESFKRMLAQIARAAPRCTKRICSIGDGLS